MNNYIIQVERRDNMRNKTIINPNDVLKAFNKALIKQHKQKSITVTYLDMDGNIKRFKSKIR